MAYCLMGLFNINMPPLYGEGGQAAFLRRHIMQDSDDLTIFASKIPPGLDGLHGLLADPPAWFAGCDLPREILCHDWGVWRQDPESPLQ
jgi:hypothetical protein